MQQHDVDVLPADEVVYYVKSLRGVSCHCTNGKKVIKKMKDLIATSSDWEKLFIKVAQRVYVNCAFVANFIKDEVVLNYRDRHFHIPKAYQEKAAEQYAEYKVNLLHKDKIIC